jgi:capsular exopolysaccharide synthesis family protein
MTGQILSELMSRLNLSSVPVLEVETIPESELLIISAQAPSPTLARDIANEAARVLIAWSEETYAGDDGNLLATLQRQMDELRSELAQSRETYQTVLAESPEDTERVDAAQQVFELKQRAYLTLLDEYESVRIQNAIRANMISIIDPANAPATPVGPRREINAALGLVVGLVGGAGLAFVMERYDARWTNAAEVEEAIQKPVLGKIPPLPKWPSSSILVADEPSAYAEAFHRLRINLLMQNPEMAPKTVLVTSPGPKDGKTTVAANLAVAAAQAGARVLLIDADLRRPAIHKVFDLPNEEGLISFLSPELPAEDPILASEVKGVWVLTSGSPEAHWSAHLGSAAMAHLLKWAERHYDLVVLDTPAFGIVPDAGVLAKNVDGVVVVVRRLHTGREALEATVEELDELGGAVLGFVLTEAERQSSQNYYRGG